MAPEYQWPMHTVSAFPTRHLSRLLSGHLGLCSQSLGSLPASVRADGGARGSAVPVAGLALNGTLMRPGHHQQVEPHWGLSYAVGDGVAKGRRGLGPCSYRPCGWFWSFSKSISSLKCWHIAGSQNPLLTHLPSCEQSPGLRHRTLENSPISSCDTSDAEGPLPVNSAAVLRKSQPAAGSSPCRGHVLRKAKVSPCLPGRPVAPSGPRRVESWPGCPPALP